MIFRRLLLCCALMVCACFLPVATFAARPNVELHVKHETLGRTMDKAYYDAGVRVDKALFDLRELGRQGKAIDSALMDKVEKVDSELRKRWLALEETRRGIDIAVNSMPVGGEHVITVEGLVDTDALYDGWTGFCAFILKWPDGSEQQIPLKSFQNGVFRPKYKYHCSPRDAMFIYGRGTSQYIARAGFDLKTSCSQDAELIVEGIDCDKPGKNDIRIRINGQIIYEGLNNFSKDSWTERRFRIPARVFQNITKTANPRSNLLATLDQFDKSIKEYADWANRQAEQVETLTADSRRGLVYRKKKYEPQWWKKHFLRGMCLITDHGLPESSKTFRPWYYHDFEHVAKEFYDAGVNLVYSYAKRAVRDDLISEFDKMGLAYIQVGWSYHRRFWSVRDAKYLSDRDLLMKDTKDFVDACKEGHSNVIGVAVDEPTIGHKRGDSPEKDPVIVEAFQKHMESQKDNLAKQGIVWEGQAPLVGKSEKPSDRPFWMAWQLFKKDYMADHYRWYWEQCEKEGIFNFTIIMNLNSIKPQAGSYVSMGKEMPLISTDLYRNGTIIEGMAMQWMKHATDGKAIMTTGSGYSCKTSDRFRRSLAVSMVHADGVLQWTYGFASKYRNPNFFWRFRGHRFNRDDRGRSQLSNWHPDFWNVQKQMYDRMSNADDCLTDAESMAKVAMVVSERTLIANSDRWIRRYYFDSIGLYSHLVRKNTPLDTLFIESLTPEKLQRYSSIVLSDAVNLSHEEMEMLRQWVSGGGTLIVSGNTSLRDEWDRPLSDFGLGDLLGVKLANAKGGKGQSFTYRGVKVSHATGVKYQMVKPASSTRIVARWNTGDPAVLMRRYGDGTVLYLTMERLGMRISRAGKESALFGEGISGVPQLLKTLVSSAEKKYPITLQNLPDGVELQYRRNRQRTVVHLLDWFDNRQVKKAELCVTAPGKWRVSYPSRADNNERIIKGGESVEIDSFRMHEMILVERVGD